jgi:hypothetical protein
MLYNYMGAAVLCWVNSVTAQLQQVLWIVIAAIHFASILSDLMPWLPALCRVAWTLFILWAVWVAVSPLHEYPLPFPGWGPFSDPRVPLGAPRLG